MYRGAVSVSAPGGDDEMTFEPWLRPGSVEAVEHGCRCDTTVNRDGRGFYVDATGTPQFVLSDTCGLHWSWEPVRAAPA